MSKGLGKTVMVLGVISILMSIYIVASFPWELTEYYDLVQEMSNEPPSIEPGSVKEEFDNLLNAVSKAVVWSGTTFLILIVGQIISGIALIVAGYVLYNSSSINVIESRNDQYQRAS